MIINVINVIGFTDGYIKIYIRYISTYFNRDIFTINCTRLYSGPEEVTHFSSQLQDE